jgi:hypothetical protein
MSWTLELFCKLGFAWNSLVIRLSSSFELDAWAKVSPVRTVSTTSGSDVETPLTVEPATFPVCVWRRINVKLKMSSSSFDRRSRNVGTGAVGGTSGSYNVVIDSPKAPPLRGTKTPCFGVHTWIYSIGVSSPDSLFAINLAAGNAFGDSVSKRRRELLMVTAAMDTVESTNLISLVARLGG